MNSFICDLFYDKHAQCSERNGARVCRVANALLSDWKEAKRDGIAPTSNGSLGMLGELMLRANPGKITKKSQKKQKWLSCNEISRLKIDWITMTNKGLVNASYNLTKLIR